MNSGEILFAAGVLFIVIGAALFWIGINPINAVWMLAAAFFFGMSFPAIILGINFQQRKYWEEMNEVKECQNE
ncbi:MAG: hypothetical protein PHX61_02490 [Alphaproteobacteria bacterium]|nr:hypothetical protein [Alphaproteobacteria bacterium]